MGDSQSKEGETEEVLECFVENLIEGPNMRISETIQTFCSVQAPDNLRQHYEERKSKLSSHAPEWFKSLADKLVEFTSDPALAGLGALAFAIFIDIFSGTPDEESTENALRCVFAEEKANKVRDQIDECLKRYRINVNDRNKLKSDFEHIERDLSSALTALRNSMVKDKQITQQALVAWVNGAAFHVQMLIHLVRLRSLRNCDSVKSLICEYQRDLDELFREHREMVKKHCGVFQMIVGNGIPDDAEVIRCFQNEEGQVYEIYTLGTEVQYFNRYYDHRFSGQLREIKQHFTEVEENLQRLVRQ